MAFLLIPLPSTLLQAVTTARHMTAAPSARSAQSMSVGIRNHLQILPTLFTQIPLRGQLAPIKSPPISKTPMIEWQLVLQSVLPPLTLDQQFP